MSKQPKPDSKKYTDLISEIQKGQIKVPKFQRNFVWSLDKTAKLLDSILKGYPIGTFILWETNERLNDIKNIECQPLKILNHYLLADKESFLKKLIVNFNGDWQLMLV